MGRTITGMAVTTMITEAPKITSSWPGLSGPPMISEVRDLPGRIVFVNPPDKPGDDERNGEVG